jgi:hypothetical protein
MSDKSDLYKKTRDQHQALRKDEDKKIGARLAMVK